MNHYNTSTFNLHHPIKILRLTCVHEGTALVAALARKRERKTVDLCANSDQRFLKEIAAYSVFEKKKIF